MSTTERTNQLSAFYAANADRVTRAVRYKVKAPGATIEDACQAAWEILCRRPDITLDEHGTSWLITVAIHAAWHLAASPDIPMGELCPDGYGRGQVPEPADPAPDPQEQAFSRLQHEARQADLRSLKPAERLSLYLLGVGHSYAEIGALTASTYTAVNRRIAEGRARLRKRERERNDSDTDVA